MSKYYQMRPSSNKLQTNNPYLSKSRKFLKKKSNSQKKYFPIPDIITQIKPYLNNLNSLNSLIKPPNQHQVALTPNSHSRILTEELLLPKKSPEFINKKTLILDLDETLVHSSFIPFENNDIVLNVEFDGMIYNIYVLVRPGAEYFIKNISKYYELVIFTASLSNYASPLLDILDKEDNIKFRLYRENCTFMNGMFIKELKKLNRNMKDLIIVDNSPLAYSFDIDNGLPIKTWYEDKNDIELYKITEILEFLAKTNDVRHFIKKFVKRNEIAYDEAQEFIKKLKNDTNKKKDKKSINSENNTNNTGNCENNINNTNSLNNISIINNNSKNISIIKKNKNSDDDNIYFNKEPLNIYEPKINKENSKNKIEIEKNIIKYETSNDNQKRSLKTAILYNPQNKKNNFLNYQDIAFIKKKNNFLENKKINEKQRNKNNNIFRFKRKKEITQNIKNDIIININNSSKVKPIMPMTLSTSLTTNMKSFLFNTTKNVLSRKNNNILKREENLIKKKNNYINILQDKKEKNKYTNLIRQINKDIINKNITNNSGIKDLIKYEKFGFDNATSKPKSRVSSSIASQRNYTPLNANKKNNKIFLSFPVQRSKSSEHFFDINNIIPKNQNEQILTKNEKRKFNNLFGGVYLGSTPRYNIFGKYLNNYYKQRRIQTAKRI